MSFERTITPVTCLDELPFGTVLPVSLDDPCNTTGKTGWNDVVKTLNGLQNIGFCGGAASGRSNGTINLPIAGYFSSSYIEQATFTKPVLSFAWVPGWYNYEFVYDVKLKHSGSTEQEIKIEFDIGGTLHTVDHVIASTAGGGKRVIGVGRTLQGLQGTLPTTLAAAGNTISSSVKITVIKSNPGTVTGSADYWDGVFSLNFRFYKTC